MEAGGYDDPSLWTAGGQAWLRGEGQLDPETEQALRGFYRRFSRDVETFISQAKQVAAMDDATADSYRRMAANWSEDEYVQAYVSQILGEQRREPVYWQDIRFNRRTQPVVGVNWYEAMAYAAWLARVTGKGYCLPSEAQWEWAARRSVRRYPWDDKWDGSKCNWRSSGLNAPNPVGQRLAARRRSPPFQQHDRADWHRGAQRRATPQSGAGVFVVSSSTWPKRCSTGPALPPGENRPPSAQRSHPPEFPGNSPPSPLSESVWN